MKKVIFTTKRCFCFLLIGLCLSMTLIAAPNDFDGDGKSDIVVIRYVADKPLTWFILQSRDGFKAVQWGGAFTTIKMFDLTVPGDYDGDGRTDIAVWRTSTEANFTAHWYVLKSSDETMLSAQVGGNGDSPAQADYDGDGKTDFAVYHGGWWYILQSRDGFYAEQFGAPNDRPLPGNDYDGDGKADLAVVRSTSSSPGNPVPMVLYLRLSRDQTWQAWNVGDRRTTWVVSGDYDGDGKADVAIWRGKQWLWVRSSDNQVESVFFGQSGDGPIPGDYDGDGKTDVAVARQELVTYFYILQSRDGFKAVQWGNNRDAIAISLASLPPSGF